MLTQVFFFFIMTNIQVKKQHLKIDLIFINYKTEIKNNTKNYTNNNTLIQIC